MSKDSHANLAVPTWMWGEIQIWWGSDLAATSLPPPPLPLCPPGAVRTVPPQTRRSPGPRISTVFLASRHDVIPAHPLVLG